MKLLLISFKSPAERGFFLFTNTQALKVSSSDTSIGSSVSADKITIKSGRNVNVEGSGVMGESGLSVKSGRDINVKASENYSTSGSYYEHHESGFSVDIGGGCVGASYNKTSLTQDNKDRQTTVHVS